MTVQNAEHPPDSRLWDDRATEVIAEARKRTRTAGRHCSRQRPIFYQDPKRGKRRRLENRRRGPRDVRCNAAQPPGSRPRLSCPSSRNLGPPVDRRRAAWAEGQEMSGHDGDTQRVPSENDEYAIDQNALPPAANRLLRPGRSLVAAVMIFIVFAAVALLGAIGITRLGPIEQLRPLLQNEAPPQPKRPDRFEQPVEPIEPLKSLVWDTAQSYFATGSLPVVTTPPAKSGKLPKTQ
jgi:hypothetical protein